MSAAERSVVEDDVAVHQGHREVSAEGDDAGDAALEEAPVPPSAAQHQPPREQVAVADVHPVCGRLQAVFTDSSPGHHLQVIGAAFIDIGEGAERQARLRNTSVSGAAWWTQMKACTNADVFGFGQAEQHRPG